MMYSECPKPLNTTKFPKTDQAFCFCKFGFFCIYMPSFMKIKFSGNGKFTLSFVGVAKSCPSREFKTLEIYMSCNAFCENKILAKISEFTEFSFSWNLSPAKC